MKINFKFFLISGLVLTCQLNANGYDKDSLRQFQNDQNLRWRENLKAVAQQVTVAPRRDEVLRKALDSAVASNNPERALSALKEADSALRGKTISPAVKASIQNAARLVTPSRLRASLGPIILALTGASQAAITQGGISQNNRSSASEVSLTKATINRDDSIVDAILVTGASTK